MPIIVITQLLKLRDSKIKATTFDYFIKADDKLSNNFNIFKKSKDLNHGVNFSIINFAFNF